jgi:predicted dehydrogenase
MGNNAIVIGAGSIGGLKNDEYDSMVTKNILTHCHACYAHNKINLVGVIDSDRVKAQNAGIKWECDYWDSINSFITTDEELPPVSIVVIATPTETHLKVIDEVCLVLNPKVIILEKPCGMDLAEARAIKEIAGNTPIAVNYIRRYDPCIQAARNDLRDAIIYSATLKYCRGLVRDGSHGIDILNWFFGECLDFKIVGNSYADHSESDRTYSAMGVWERCPIVSIQAVDGRVCNVFELEIMTDKGSLRFVDNFNQIKIRCPEEDQTYGNYLSLSETEHVAKTELHTDLLRLYDNVIANIEGREKLLCTIDDAIAVHKVIEGGKV